MAIPRRRLASRPAGPAYPAGPAWLLLLLVISGEAISTHREIGRRTGGAGERFLRQAAEAKAVGASTAGASTALVDGTTASTTTPALVETTATISSAAHKKASLQAQLNAATQAQLGVKCYGICTALVIISAVAATGGAVAAGVLLANANAGLQQLGTVADANTEHGVSNCFEMRQLVFKIELAQVAFNMLFDHANVESLVDIGDVKLLGEPVRREDFLCDPMPTDESLFVPELNFDSFATSFTVDDTDGARGTAEDGGDGEAFIDNELQTLREETIEKMTDTSSCHMLSEGGCQVCVGNARATHGLLNRMFRTTCKWCEPEEYGGARVV